MPGYPETTNALELRLLDNTAASSASLCSDRTRICLHFRPHPARSRVSGNVATRWLSGSAISPTGSDSFLYRYHSLKGSYGFHPPKGIPEPTPGIGPDRYGFKPEGSLADRLPLGRAIFTEVVERHVHDVQCATHPSERWRLGGWHSSC